MVELTQTMRQKDDLPFTELLHRVRTASHTDDDIRCIQSRGMRVSSQLSKDSHGKDICLRCLNAFGRLTKKEKEAGKKSLLEIHRKLCSEHKLQHSIYPKEGEFTKFKNVERLHDVFAAFYCDFEGFVEPVSFAANDTSKSFTIKTIHRVDFVS